MQTVKFKISEPDMWDASLSMLIWLHMRKPIHMIVFYGLMGAWIMVETTADTTPAINKVMIGVAGVIGVMTILGLIMWYSNRRLHRSINAFQNTQTVELKNDGLFWKESDSHSNLKWDQIEDAAIIRNQLLLQYKVGQTGFIPLKYFSDQSEAKTWLTTIKDGIKRA